MNFARNFTKRGTSPPKRSKKKSTAAPGEKKGLEALSKINQIIGMTQSHGHLYPPIRSEKDISKLFGEYDVL